MDKNTNSAGSAGRDVGEDGACPTCGVPADIKTHWNQTEIDAAKWRARELGKEIGWGGEEGAGGLRAVLHLGNWWIFDGDRAMAMATRKEDADRLVGSASSSPQRAFGQIREAAERVVLAYRRTGLDIVSWASGVGKAIDSLAALLGEAPPTKEAEPPSQREIDLVYNLGAALVKIGSLRRFVKMAEKKCANKYNACTYCARFLPSGHDDNCPLILALEALEPTVTPELPPGATVQPQAEGGAE